MDYLKQLRSVGNVGIGVDSDPPDITVPYQEGISDRPAISYKQGLAFKPKFVKYTINTAVPGTYEFYAPANNPG